MPDLFLNPNLRIICDTKKDKGYIIDSKTNNLIELNLDAISLLTHNIKLLNSNEEKYKNFIDYAFENNLLQTTLPDSASSINYLGHDYHLKKVQFEITSICNLKCLHCFCDELNSEKEEELDLPTIKGLIDQAAEMGVIDFYLTGGEPLVRKDLFEIIKYLNLKKIRPGIFTNGTLLTDNIVKEFSKHNISYVQLSLDGHNAETHDSFRMVKGSFDKAVRSIRMLKDSGIPLSVTVIINKYNINYLKEISSFLTDELQVSYGFDRLISYGNALKNESISVSAEEVANQVKELLPQEQKVNTLCMENYNFKNNEYTPPYCGMGYDFLYVNFKGDVLVCPTITPENFSYKSYNIKDVELADIWLDKIGDGISKFRGTQCKKISTCSVGPTCLGGCRSNALIEGNDIDDIDKYMCKLLTP